MDENDKTEPEPKPDENLNWLDALQKDDKRAAHFAANLLTTHFGTDATKLAAVLLLAFRMMPDRARDVVHDMCSIADRIDDADACCLPRTASQIARSLTGTIVSEPPQGKPS